MEIKLSTVLYAVLTIGLLSILFITEGHEGQENRTKSNTMVSQHCTCDCDYCKCK